MERSYAQGSTAGTDIKRYAAGVKLVRVQDETSDMRKDGQRLIGSVTAGDPTVSGLDIERKVPSATITSCLDVSRWDVVDAKTRKKLPLPSGRLTKFVNVSTLERWPDGWKVIEDDPQEGKPC
ncbi:secreted protein/lipoprotein [Streptomyces sp. NPDC060022]|uniref:secreted protein/lipoprotein n=1 Tax=Streptomyces sp. NPDC060022 TaxID=3347039 RepID=UPI00367EC989